MGRSQLEDACEECARWRSGEKGQVVAECFEINRAPNVRMLQQRLDLRCEEHPFRSRRVVQRFLAGTVAGKEEALTRLVPDGERKHPVQSLEALLTVYCVR